MSYRITFHAVNEVDLNDDADGWVVDVDESGWITTSSDGDRAHWYSSPREAFVAMNRWTKLYNQAHSSRWRYYVERV